MKSRDLFWVSLLLSALFAACSSVEPSDETDDPGDDPFSDDTQLSQELPFSYDEFSSLVLLSSEGQLSSSSVALSSFEGGDCLPDTPPYALFQMPTISQSGEEAVDALVHTLRLGVTPEQLRTVPRCDAKTVSEATKIEQSGDYIVTGRFEGKINVLVPGVHLFLKDAHITNTDKKAVEGDEDYVLTLIGDNSLSNSGGATIDDPKHVLESQKTLTINGSGSLSVNSMRSGIKAKSTLFLIGGKINVTADKHGINGDGIYMGHTEVTVADVKQDAVHSESNDEVTSFSYTRGFVVVDEGTILKTEKVLGDGIDAATFVSVLGGDINIKTQPTWKTAPARTTEGCYHRLATGAYVRASGKDLAGNSFSDRKYSCDVLLERSVKGIKVGPIVYTVNNREVEVSSKNYLTQVKGGTIITDVMDDAIHTNSGNVVIRGGEMELWAGDDGVHAAESLIIYDGDIDILNSYEGLEAGAIVINDGTIKVKAEDDGTNASKYGSRSSVAINGGKIYIDVEGDGYDSNGSFNHNGGESWVLGPSFTMNSALDAQNGFQMNGGFLLSASIGRMQEEIPSNTQQYYAYITYRTERSGNFKVELANGEVFELSPQQFFGRAKKFRQVVVSHPSFGPGTRFTLTAGGITNQVTLGSAKRTAVSF